VTAIAVGSGATENGMCLGFVGMEFYLPVFAHDFSREADSPDPAGGWLFGGIR
jgi:hypothetical protein